MPPEVSAPQDRARHRVAIADTPDPERKGVLERQLFPGSLS